MKGLHDSRLWRRLTTAFIVLPLLACVATASADERIVTDMRDRPVAIPAQVTRAIGTGGAVDAWFLLLGAQDKLVATSTTITKNPWFAKFYPRIRQLPTPISSNDINIEDLTARQPQVAILLSGMASIDKIERAGIPTVVLERRNAEELMRAVSIAADVLGPAEREAAARFCAYYRANIAKVSARVGTISPERRTRVYYAGGAALATEGKNTLVSSWIELAGGRNVAEAAGVNGMSGKVSMEDVIAADPEVIVTLTPTVRDEILSDASWRSIAAVREGRVHVNPKSAYSWGVRSAEEAIQVLWAATIIHPELFGDIDMVAETRAFHAAFFKVALGDADIRHILNAEPPDPSPAGDR
ncbi:iron complex transport system substrate-binding protein [Rhodoblastus sphagnicola]|nr:ABC transporter substrate-binding protein [Rhodoblastus sphagnicola]MBB4200008.1 iron complex transport system substrate-binding protein [Rhodoblastus sphagnicola]